MSNVRLTETEVKQKTFCFASATFGLQNKGTIQEITQICVPHPNLSEGLKEAVRTFIEADSLQKIKKIIRLRSL